MLVVCFMNFITIILLYSCNDNPGVGATIETSFKSDRDTSHNSGSVNGCNIGNHLENTDKPVEASENESDLAVDECSPLKTNASLFFRCVFGYILFR